MTIHIIGGGTIQHIRSHLALAAPAYGGTARKLHEMITIAYASGYDRNGYEDWPKLHLTKMADHRSKLETNDDVAALIDELIANEKTRVIIMNAALCDYTGEVLYDSPSSTGKYGDRLKTSDGPRLVEIVPSDKLIGRIRKDRKDIFVVGFKTTTGATSDEQYVAGLHLLKANSVNLVLANDTVTRNNMIIAPEETRYFETASRDEVLDGLVQMVMARKDNTFTRSTVVEGELVPWTSDLIPDNLREVVNYCVDRGAYKAFRNSTAGHFAVRLNDRECLTSVRKTNYNETLDLVRVEYDGLDKVVAHGAKPSVGGQSQRLVFQHHPEADAIVHFHCPVRQDARDADFISHASQVFAECGSTNCGKNTSDNLRVVSADIKAVMLDNHGPNIVFSRNTPAAKVIDFIEANFDLSAKTGGLVSA